MNVEKLKKKSLKAILKSIAMNDDLEVLKYITSQPVYNEKILSINDLVIFDNYYFFKFASYNNAINSIKYIFENVNNEERNDIVKSRKYAFFKNITITNNFNLYKYVYKDYPEIKKNININYEKDILFLNVLNNPSYDFLDFFLNEYNDKIKNKKECLRLYVNNLFNNNDKEYQDKFIKILDDKRLYNDLLDLDYSRAFNRAVLRNDMKSIDIILKNPIIKDNILNSIHNELKVTLSVSKNPEIIKKVIIENNIHKDGYFDEILNNKNYDTKFLKLCLLEDELFNSSNSQAKPQKNKI